MKRLLFLFCMTVAVTSWGQGSNPDGTNGFYNPNGIDNGSDIQTLQDAVSQYYDPANGSWMNYMRTGDLSAIGIGGNSLNANWQSYVRTDANGFVLAAAVPDSWLGFTRGTNPQDMYAGTSLLAEAIGEHLALIGDSGAANGNATTNVISVQPPNDFTSVSGDWAAATSVLSELKASRQVQRAQLSLLCWLVGLQFVALTVHMFKDIR